MKYHRTSTATFIRRLNRFIAEVKLEDAVIQVHVPNTGRCRELFLEGTPVVLEHAATSNRRTAYSLVSVYKGDRLINIDAQGPNKIVEEALNAGQILSQVKHLHLARERTEGDSRFDFYYEGIKEDTPVRGYIEVKGVTLEVENRAYFPDAPTLRGLKHLVGLSRLAEEGFENYVIFCIQMEGVVSFSPNTLMQPAFTKALKAMADTVGILAFDCHVTADDVTLKDAVPVMWD
ncbi:DNA/RNA nuclease SfsA [Peptoniphilus equinus]|uniref:Sugar fermentation stimulation protein homolog n=1 Tax=Peptoniphilus equinus TaxID=3016343 RepID=A0ABY7QT42_9FIRM|nr:DNA/RNA nuclease SfsA [Peptoniphilus equinus]WBW49944.1 DNA/RNA nuclease SfsA [Peptoniphilus equinus]